MADEVVPLTDEERAELEALRAEKAARIQAEQAARERAELEALRNESARAAQPPARLRLSSARPPVAQPIPKTSASVRRESAGQS